MKKDVLTTYENESPILYMCARDMNIAPGTRCGPMVSDMYIVECCTSGSGSVIINDLEIPFKAGDCYIIQPGQKVLYTTSKAEPRCGVWCSIGGLAVSKAVSAIGVDSENPFAPWQVFDGVVSAICGMIDSAGESDMGAELRKRGFLYMLLGSLAGTIPAQDNSIWAKKAMGYIETNYYKDISVSDMAREMGLERCYFSTLFRSYTGTSPHAYLSQVRIRKACALIGEKNYSVSEAAEMVGLDPQNLARSFKKLTGKLPRDYKTR